MGIIEIIAIVLLIMWLGGFALNVGGSMVHVLLVLAIVVYLARYFRHRAV